MSALVNAPRPSIGHPQAASRAKDARKRYKVRYITRLSCRKVIRTYNNYMPNKTISVPDDVIPVIESLDVPFSRWVTDQLRRYAAKSTVSFADQLLADAALAAGERLPDRAALGHRMERSAPW